MNTYLITGCAGFIGYHLSLRLLNNGDKVVGLDSINNYYSVKLKNERLNNLKKFKNFIFIKDNLTTIKKISTIIKKYKISEIVHLAAQAGVRLSLKEPKKYFDNNILGFFNILEACRISKCKKFIFASSSSVYGESSSKVLNEKISLNPIQFYATTKVCNEEMAKIYSKIYGINTIGLRFFTVYGSWGRPDMAYYKFGLLMLKNKQIEVYNNGQHKRDFTFIDDVVNSIILILKKKPKKKTNLNTVYNISNFKSYKLFELIELLEKYLKIKAKVKFKRKQQGDIKNTLGSSKKLFDNYKYKPNTSLKHGVKKFCDWLLKYKNNKPF